MKDFNEKIFQDESLRSNHINRSKEIALKAFKEMVHVPKNVLSLNKNWIGEMLVEQGLRLVQLEDASPSEKFDTVLAIDEEFTHARNEDHQKQLISRAVSYVEPNGILMTSIRDYRNTNCHQRPIGDSALHNINGDKWVTTEINELSHIDKQSWNQNYYVVKNDVSFEFIQDGPRRTLYFKQLAKYCADLKCKQFSVLKDIFWRGTLRRTPEHLMWARF